MEGRIMATEDKKEKLFSINKEAFPALSNEDFDAATFDSDVPVIVLFGAERCKVCKELYPELEELLPTYAGRLRSYYVDVDEQKELMSRFRLRGIPTLLLFKDGEVQQRLAGMQSEEELAEKIGQVVG
jgi:thioredoxin 1